MKKSKWLALAGAALLGVGVLAACSSKSNTSGTTYGYEKMFHSLEQLEQAIVDYIDYYNNKRIKVKLKGLGPVQYRTAL